MEMKESIAQGMIFHHYQPIFQLRDNKIFGYEALLRSKRLSTPEDIIQSALKENQLYELDTWSIQKAIQTYQFAGYTSRDGKLCINVLLSTLLHPKFPNFMDNVLKRIINQQIVLEIDDQDMTAEYENIKAVIDYLKKKGILIAMDYFGGGIFDFQKVIEINPNYIKLDRYYSEELNYKSKKQSIVKLLINYCRKYKLGLILEGLESKEEILFAKSLGVSYGQGFGLAKPDRLKAK